MSNNIDFSERPWLDPEAEPFIRIQGLTKNFGAFTAVDSVDLDIYKGELFSLLGGSGCGKTTLLRMLAGFETPSAGRVFIDGTDMTDVPPYERPVNMMFQSYALFPHMNVEANVAYGLKRDGVAKGEIKRRVHDMLEMVELGIFSKRKPHQLSGGQRQRVALARSLVKKPKVLLLDEPLGALDKRLREQTQFELMNIQDELGVTFVVVTHDQEEAMTLSTRIAVMDEGQFVQIGTPTEIYEYPDNRFVANFIGSANMFEGRVQKRVDKNLVVNVPALKGELIVEYSAEIADGSKVWLAIRPEKMSISTTLTDTNSVNVLSGIVHDIGYLGSMSTYRIELEDKKIIDITYPNQHRPRDGKHLAEWDDKVYLKFDPSNVVLLTR
jgi:putrescine transport system ATP-binding protein